jgi:hypothetical protein
MAIKMDKSEQRQVSRDVQIWDSVKAEWVKGFDKTIERLPDSYELKWTNCTTTNKAPDGIDLEIDVERASKIAIQADSTPTLNTGTSIDLNVIASIDGVNYDTTSYAEMNIGDAELKTMLLEAGPFKIKFRLDYNSGGTRADVIVRVKVRE